MKSPIAISSFELTIQKCNYTIKPRLEPIVFASQDQTECFGYELLCAVYADKWLNPDVFFNNLPDVDVLRIYNQSLQQLPLKGKLHVTLNINNSLLTSPALYQLLAMFPNLSFYLELSEKSSTKYDFLRAHQLICSYDHLDAQIWLDDFGSNHANFDRLLSYRFDGIKLAKEVFWGLYDNDRDLLRRIILFLQKNCRLVIIEGVDSSDRFNFATANECAAQGYFISAL